MNSGQLANNALTVCIEANRRFLTTGHQQYSNVSTVPEGNEGLTKEVEEQQFEYQTLGQLLEGLEEELLDTINWSAMAVMKLREKREKIDRNLKRARDAS